MVYIHWASHALQGQIQKVIIARARINLKKLSKFGL